MTVDSRVVIHECPYKSFACSNYTCARSVGVKLYYISNPHGAMHDVVYCGECLKHMLRTVPAELTEGGEDLALRIRTDIEAEYKKQAEVWMQAETERITKQVTMELAAQFAQVVKPEPMPELDYAITTEPGSDEAPLDDDDETPTYRCLVCNEEFDSPQKLGSHRRKHEQKETKQTARKR